MGWCLVCCGRAGSRPTGCGSLTWRGAAGRWSCCCTAGRTGRIPGTISWLPWPRPGSGWQHRGCAATRRPGPAVGYLDIGTLAVDVRELIGVLGGGDPCLLAGQDWGTSISYQVLAGFPEVVRSAVVMAVPHPAATRESLLRAEHVHRSFHWFFFQLRSCRSGRCARTATRSLTGCGTLDRARLHRWGAPGRGEAHAGRTWRAGGGTGLRPGHVRPGQGGSGPGTGAAGGRPADVVPTPALCGAEDKRAEVMQDQARHFTGPTGSSSCPAAATSCSASSRRGHEACPGLGHPAMGGIVTPN